MKIEIARAESIPAAVLDLARTLREAGGEAWIVGGAVRDLLLDRPVRDWDLATDLLPERVAELFPRSHSFGMRFGTVVVVRQALPYEITTFRRDGIYSDARRPDSVQFTREVDEDLARRDFTINALAFDPLRRALRDPTGGRADLEAGWIRAVGRPRERFQEDGLRLLRAVRLRAELGFEVEAETFAALVLSASRIEKIAAERIREEMDKILESPDPASAFDLMHQVGLLRRLLPELAACYGVPQNPHHAYDVFYHSLAAMQNAPTRHRVVRLAALLHDLGKPESRQESDESASFYSHQLISERLAERILRRLRYSNEERERVCHLVRQHMFHYRPEWTDSAVRRFLRDVGAESLDDLFELRAADTRGNGLRRRLAPELAELRGRIDREIERASALSVRDLAIGGHDLMDLLGIGPGPEVGRILNLLLQEVLDDPARNERGYLLERSRELFRPDC